MRETRDAWSNLAVELRRTARWNTLMLSVVFERGRLMKRKAPR